MRLVFTLLFLLPSLYANAQRASDFFPELPGATWNYNLTIALDDSTTQIVPRTDVLASMQDHGVVSRLTISSSAAGLQNYELVGDTVKASLDVALPLGGLLQSDSLLATLFDTQLPQTTLFTTRSSLNTKISLNTFTQRIPTPDVLRGAIEQESGIFSVTLDDSINVVIERAFKRLPNAITTVSSGEFDALIFESIIGISVSIGARNAILGRITLNIPLLEDYIVTSWYAPRTGLIKQHAVPRELGIDDRLLPVDVDLEPVRIPGFELDLTAFTPPPVTSLRTDYEIPAMATLLPNYPNPFNPSTVITFELNEASQVNIRIFDSTGRLVTLLSDAFYPIGLHQITFKATTKLSSGLYLTVVTVQGTDGRFSQLQQPMLLLK
jgi:hypothetical protein